MSKTVVSILLVAAAVAVIAIPGVGTAIGGALVSAGLASSAAAGAAIATATAVSIGLSAASMLLMGTPKLPKPETSASSIKTPVPPRISAYGRSRLYGAYVLFENTTFSTTSDIFSPYAIDVLAVHDGKIDGIEQRYLADDKVYKTGNKIDFLPHHAYGDETVHWYETLGNDTETAFSEIVAKLPGKWTSAHRGDGVVALGIVWRPVSSDEFSERFPHGACEASISARWQHCFDWRDEAQSVNDPSTWTWTENAVLHLAHYRLVREKARRSPGAILPSGADLLDAWNLFFAPTIDYWTEAANVCDELVPVVAGGFEARYRSCFSHKHTDPHKNVLDSLTSCFDGWTSPRADGALVVYAGKFYDPTVSIGPDEIVSYGWTYGVKDEEAINELKITYVSHAHDYNPVDADPWTDVDDMEARGAIRTDGEDFAVPSHGQARRLAKRKMARIMSSNRGTVTTNVAGRIVRGERYINLRLEEAGAVFFDGVAEIVGLTRNIATGGVTFSWVEITENIDAWNPETEEGLPAPTSTRVVLTAPPAPEIDDAVLLFDASGQDSTGVRIQITLAGPSGEDLIWFARWRRVGEAVWNEQRYSDVDSSSGVELITGFVPTDEDLEVEVAYRHGAGAISPWSDAFAVATDMQSVAPDAAASITMTGWADTLDLSTPTIPRASSYRWRFYKSDGTTLLRTISTTERFVSYTRDQAIADGAQRDYKVDVAGVNSAGTGTTVMSGLLSNAAPAAPTGVSATGGTYSGSITFTPPSDSDLAGFVVYYSTTTGFDPMTTGNKAYGLGSPIAMQNLPSGTYYALVAGYDLWTEKPSLLNFASEVSFTISSGVGGGGGGGGYCVTIDTPIEMADGSLKPAGELKVGDLVRTQHEDTLAWGDFPVEAIEIVESDDIWAALGICATGDHRVWLGGGWVKMRDIGEPVVGSDDVARITITDAHTYYSRGILSHNVKVVDTG